MLTLLMFLADGTSIVQSFDASQLSLIEFTSNLYAQDFVLDVEILSYDGGSNGYIVIS